MKIESLDQAIHFLSEKGWIISRYNKIYLVTWSSYRGQEEYTDRELILTAKSLSENTIRGGKEVKEYQHRGNRAKTRQDISRECYENFSKNKPRYIEDRWNWD